MKKSLIILLSIFSILLVSSCEKDEIIEPNVEENDNVPEIETPEPEFDESLENENLLDTIVVYLQNNISLDINMDFGVLTKYEDVELTWTSNSDKLIINDGICRVTRSEDDVIVNLSVLITLDDLIREENFEINILRYLSSIEAIEVTTQNLSEKANYYKNTSGFSETLEGLIDVTQEIQNNVYYFEDYAYFVARSNSSYVNFTHRAMFKDEKVAYSHDSWSSTSEKSPSDTISVEDYCKSYGLDSTWENFTGFVINEDTLLSSSYLGYNNYIHSYEYDLDIDLSCYNLKVQMKAFGGLVSLPTFTNIKVIIYVDNDYNIVSFDSHELYYSTKKVFFNQTVYLEQKLTTKFIDFDPIDLPDSFPNMEEYINAI